MFVAFESLPENSRVWLYQTDRELTEAESETVSEFLKSNIESWLTHGMPMKGSFKILHSRILLIAADVNFQNPSGCSIDSSTRWLKELGLSLNVDFFDRSIGYYKDQDLYFFPFFDAKKKVASGDVTSDTKIINQQVKSIKDLSGCLTIPARESFLKRHFEIENAL
jgi:hypothetical protein